MSRGGARVGAGRKPRPDRQDNKPLGIRCSPETAERLRRLATTRGVSLGDAVEMLLNYHDRELKYRR